MKVVCKSYKPKKIPLTTHILLINNFSRMTVKVLVVNLPQDTYPPSGRLKNWVGVWRPKTKKL